MFSNCLPATLLPAWWLTLCLLVCLPLGCLPGLLQIGMQYKAALTGTGAEKYFCMGASAVVGPGMSPCPDGSMLPRELEPRVQA